MNILVVSDRYPEFGAAGAGIVAHSLARKYKSEGHRVRVATTFGEVTNDSFSGKGCRQTDVDGIQTIAFPTISDPRFRYHYTIYNPWVLRPFRSWLKSQKEWVDAVHVHNVHQFFSYAIFRTIKRVTDARIVHTYHDAMSFAFGKLHHFVNDDPSSNGRPDLSEYRFGIFEQIKQARKRYNPFRNAFAHHFLRKYADAHIGISNELSRALQSNGLPVSDVIHNGIDTELYRSRDPDRFRAEFEDIDDQFVLFAGRASDMKGGHRLATAVAKSDTNPQLVFIGESEHYVEELKKRVPELSNGIRSLGWIDRMLLPHAYAAATIVATPSIYLDPFILVNLEAMAAGTAVITTCYGGAKEVVTHEDTGIVVNPFDSQSFADYIDRLMSDEAYRASIQKKATERVRDHFNIDDKASAYLHYLSGASPEI